MTLMQYDAKLISIFDLYLFLIYHIAINLSVKSSFISIHGMNLKLNASTCSFQHALNNCSWVKVKGWNQIKPSTRYPSMSNKHHTALPATWHKWTSPALMQASKLVLDLPTGGLEGWRRLPGNAGSPGSRTCDLLITSPTPLPLHHRAPYSCVCLSGRRVI